MSKREILMSLLLYKKLLTREEIHDIITTLGPGFESVDGADSSVDGDHPMDIQTDDNNGCQQSVTGVAVGPEAPTQALDLSVGQYVCFIEGCDRRFKRPDIYQQHVEGIHLKPVFQCADCGITYMSKRGLNLHRKKCLKITANWTQEDHQRHQLSPDLSESVVKVVQNPTL